MPRPREARSLVMSGVGMMGSESRPVLTSRMMHRTLANVCLRTARAPTVHWAQEPPPPEKGDPKFPGVPTGALAGSPLLCAESTWRGRKAAGARGQTPALLAVALAPGCVCSVPGRVQSRVPDLPGRMSQARGWGQLRGHRLLLLATAGGPRGGQRCPLAQKEKLQRTRRQVNAGARRPQQHQNHN